MLAISIVIPIYNAEKYLEECLDSILRQTFSDFEVVMVDDGSQDCSSAICMRYAEADERFVYIYKENGGVSSARNKGIEHAKGEWVCFVDADDWIKKEYLETMLSKAETESAGLVVCSYESEYHNVTTDNDEPVVMNKENMVNFLYLTNKYGYQGYIWNKMFCRDIIMQKDIRFDENARFNEDRLFCLQYVCEMSGKAVFLKNKLYHYCKRENSVMYSVDNKFNKAIFSDFDTSVKMLRILQDAGYPKQTVNLARDRILDSYDYIRHKMQRTHYENALEEKRKLKEKAISISGGMFFFISNRIRRFLSKQINHFAKNKVYLEKIF